MKYTQNHFENTFGSAYFKPNKTELKLAKTVKKEPRKSSFPWDLGLLFVKPMKYAIIYGFNIFKSRSWNLLIFFNLPCKTDDFLMLDLECLMILFRIEIYTMSFEVEYLCRFYFDATDPNDNKDLEHSNQVRKMIFLKEKEREIVLEAWECWALESSLVEHRGTMSFRRSWRWGMLPPFTHPGHMAEIFKPLGVSLGESLESRLSPCSWLLRLGSTPNETKGCRPC